MYKKIVSVFLIILIVIGAIYILTPDESNPNKVFAEDYRGGWLLLPDGSDSTGVFADSTFTLKSLTDTSLEKVQEIFSIDGQEKPGIVQIESNIYRITPNEPFDKNKLYTFRITTSSGADITWTFQTSAPFMIAGSLPANQTTNVPIDTGIELYFSHSEYGNPDKYFEIVPKMEGRFERHKNTIVFIPEKPLEYGTLYTVTVKKGLKTKDGNETLESDFIFSFETKLEEKEQTRYDTGYIFFNKVLSEYSTEEKPFLPVNYYFRSNSNSDNEKFTVQGSVYSYKSVDAFLESLEAKNKIPIWAYYSYMNNNLTDTKGLSKVMTFENELQKVARTNEDLYIRLPSNLPEGYYIVDCTWEDMRFQTFIEVTDLSVYMTSDSNSILFWVNDIKTGNPVEGATVSIHKDNNQSWKTNDKGVALFTPENSSELNDNTSSYEKYFKIKSPDGRTAIIRKYENQNNRYSYYYDMINFSYKQNNYWRYIQLDRTLYKPNDTVYFWGFLKNRVEEEKIDRVTVEITRGGYYSDYSGEGWYCFPTRTNEPVAKTLVQVNDGAFDGKIKLPFLEQGSYMLQIKIGDSIVKSTYLEVQNYIKPAYKMEISKDKKVVFWDETVEFTVKTAFFEGTALPGLDLDYQFDFYQGKSVNGRGKTDGDGQFKVSLIPGIKGNIQGETWANFFSNATLPESGQINSEEGLRVFANDINVSIIAKLSKDSDTGVKTGVIDFKVNDIILDRINEGTAENDWDYLGNPSEGISLNGYIIRNRWIKTQNGTYYDFINKKVMPKYRYDLKKETVTAINVTTDNNGETSFSFNAPEISDGYYTYEVSCKDNRSKMMKFSGHIGEYWVYNYYEMDDNRYFLDGVKENYKDDSTVSLEYKKGMDLLPEASYLFIRSQNGIVDYAATSKPAYEFKMSEICIPNIFVNGIYFNGKTYINSGNVNIGYNYSEKELVIEAKADKEAYKPGEEVVIKIKAKDKSGKGVKAIVNAGIVDEALFSLQDMTVETLSVLYEFIPSGINQSYATHINSETDLYYSSGGYDEGLRKYAGIASMENMDISLEFESDKSSAVRENFQDTALFKTVILDDNGEGEIKFTLPDNITSWRITLTGISQNLDAGSNTESLIVSLPFFINYSFNTTYIAGDLPFVGVTGYGSSLSEDDEITYMISTSSNPSVVNEVKGKAFERINIPVGTLSVNDKFILIKAKSSNGFEDSLKHEIEVRNSYHEIATSEYYDLLPGIKISGGTGGNTRLLFMDKGRGKFYPALMSYIWQGGNRIDQQLPKLISEEMIQKYFESDDEFFKDESFKASDYQTGDGGIAILPYGPSDFELTAKLVPFLKDKVDMFKLKRYLYSVYEDENIGSVKGAALYGLAVMREPVLLEIGKAASVNNAGLKNLLYLCLAYCELGEQPQAKRLYDEKISEYVKRSGKFSWIDSGSDKDDVLETTALGLMLSTYIDSEDGDDGEGFYKYCLENRTNDILINMEVLAYIKNQIETADTVTGSFTFTYMGKTEKVVLEQGRMVSKDIPSANISDFVIDKVEGNVALVSIFKQPPTGLEKPDSKISVSRSYFNLNGEKTTTFKQDDVVKVQIKFDFDKKAIDGSYEITDYLPSGLKPIENTWRYAKTADLKNYWYGKVDGQKSTFYVYHSSKNEEYQYETITYYARVVSAGTYTAESTIIQGVGNTAGINQGAREVLTIR